jgi:Tol biopolymer transport system component
MIRTLWIAGITIALVAPALHADPLLFLENAAGPSWSPDGGTVACMRMMPPGGTRNVQVWLAPLAGEPSVLTADTLGALWPVWLADGQQIAYHHDNTFVIVDLQGQRRASWPVTGLWDDVAPSLSRDGQSLWYGTSANETRALDLTTGTTSLVVAGLGAIESPDGQWIAYTGADDSLVVAPLGAPPTHVLGRGFLGGWTSDSQHLVFTRVEESGTNFVTDLVLVSRDGTRSFDLTDDEYTEWWPRVSPTRNQVVYWRSLGESLPFEVWLVDFTIPSSIAQQSWTGVKRAFRSEKR